MINVWWSAWCLDPVYAVRSDANDVTRFATGHEYCSYTYVTTSSTIPQFSLGQCIPA